MLTGKQVREACTLLDWDHFDLQRHSALSFGAVDRAGIEFLPGGGVLLRKDDL